MPRALPRDAPKLAIVIPPHLLKTSSPKNNDGENPAIGAQASIVANSEESGWGPAFVSDQALSHTLYSCKTQAFDH